MKVDVRCDCAEAVSRPFPTNSAFPVLQSSRSDGAQKEVKYEPFSFPDGEYRQLKTPSSHLLFALVEVGLVVRMVREP